jgi:hypothetical protein
LPPRLKVRSPDVLSACPSLPALVGLGFHAAPPGVALLLGRSRFLSRTILFPKLDTALDVVLAEAKRWG